jgi:hypothetical protein
MRQKEYERSTLVNDDSYDTDRINEIVKASDLLHKSTMEQNEELTVDNNTKNTIRRVFYPFFNQYPEMEKYAPEGQVIDIRFDEEFESKLLNKDIIELSNNDTLPQDITFTIKPVNSDNSFKESLNVQNDRDIIERLVNHYGDGHLDSLIGKSIILEPSTEYYSKYDISVPENTATGKLKAKFNKLYSKYFKRGEKYARIKFFTVNSVRAGLFLFQAFIIYGYIYLSLNRPANITTEEYFEVLIGGFMGIVLTILMLNLVSLALNEQSCGGNEYVGALELSIFIYIRDIFKHLQKNVSNLNKTIGDKINL